LIPTINPVMVPTIGPPMNPLSIIGTARKVMMPPGVLKFQKVPQRPKIVKMTVKIMYSRLV